MSSTEKMDAAAGVVYHIRLSPTENSSRPRVRLGKVTKKQADTARTHIEQLIACKRTGSTMPPATAQWLVTLDSVTRSRLNALGLLNGDRSSEDDILVGAWAADYIEKRTDIKPRTRQNMTQARAFLMEFLEDDLPLSRFTPGHADDFRLFLLRKGQAEATVRRRCKRSKQFFAAAIKHGHISTNPFDGVQTSNVANVERRVFVERATVETVMEACPDEQWKLIFALARYGGLRIPSEIQGLRWMDIDWAQKRFTVHCPKTEHIEGKKHRVIPLFPELVPHIAAWQRQRRPGEELVFPTLVKRSNLREHALRIIRKAGLKPWTRVFQNLRASRETELVEDFPIHVVTAWLGNSPETAIKHYLSVRDTHFERAAEDGAAEILDRFWTYSGHTMDDKGCQALTGKNDNPAEALVLEGIDSESQSKAISGKSLLAPPRGVEPLFPG